MTELAARVGDPHVCPAHVGGPILPPGCPTVVIGNLPAARVDDQCECQGAVDVIATGAGTVLIGGKPAARMGDTTEHAGVIVFGFPTVLIGSGGDPVDDLFKDPYLKSLIGMKFEGENDPELRKAMETLARHRDDPDHPEVAEALAKIAELRKRPLSELQQEWKRTLDLEAEQRRRIAEKGLDPIEELNEKNRDFMGTTSQLRYGKVVGDALGVDPVFGAYLNPTGGLVGPGNKAVDCNDSALGYHGAVHDAAGYLYNYQQRGPGYNYLRRENRDTSDPLSGQRSGIEYWRGQLPDRTLKQKVVDRLGNRVMDGVVPIWDNGGSTVWEKGNKAYERISGGYKDAQETEREARERVRDASSDAWKWLTGESEEP
ncbi:Hypothetical protein CAP_8560 [Chondromyces apiculatus DSM 436]|uniref:Zn-binding Pro-Ala-Ala-Arg (PAAR) domain-containing protein, incolved in TypeVI secretion n=1 Tax=Chondromyces apiculatus DSM 436 TaxID=1192034 RepID=A0A017SW74_9BACT|nr:PAAR domain-containing protein [Chondromyces apiculatus]EYF01219.1 Hypothetical protein CAP_8560 [Chondromyces apiculatus DSM 436]